MPGSEEKEKFKRNKDKFRAFLVIMFFTNLKDITTGTNELKRHDELKNLNNGPLTTDK
jgi:hypothetical protein